MAVISWDNYVDDSTLSTAATATGSEVLAIANLKTRQLAEVFRWTFPGSGTLNLDFDLGSSKVTDLVGILNHDMQGYTYSILFSDVSAGGSDIGTEGPNVFWAGTADDGPHELLYLTTALTARYIRLAVTIPGSGTVDVGRVWLDSAWSINVSMDFQLGIVDRSTITKSRGGSAYSSDKAVLRKLVCKAIGLSNVDMIGDAGDPLLKSFLTMDLAVGKHGEIILLPLTDSQINRQRLGVYGHISDNQPIQILDKGGSGFLTNKRFTIEEDR